MFRGREATGTTAGTASQVVGLDSASRHPSTLGNLLITKDWRLWLIDFTRAFGAQKELPNPGDLVKCDRKLLARLKEFNKPLLERELKPYVNDTGIDGLLARRDRIVKFFEDRIARRGEAEVLFDLDRVGEPCGVGLQAAFSGQLLILRGGTAANQKAGSPNHNELHR